MGAVANILIKVLAGGLQFVALLLYGLIDKASGLGIDDLVFGRSGDGLGILSLFKAGSPAQDYLAVFYNVFNYIAIIMFIPIILWVGFNITKAGDSPQQKSFMKDRLIKIAFTFVLLYTMPEFLTLLAKFSSVLVSMFNNVANEFIGDANLEQFGGKGGIIEQFIIPLESTDVNIANAVSALILVGVNIWMIGFYIIRDLTVSFLFLIFPIIAIWHPFNTSMSKNWWIGMAGNILAQPIQALVLTLVLALSSALQSGVIAGVGEGGPGFAYSLFIIVAFASIIPMTSLIKGFLGLESGVGAGNSRAGMGGAMAAILMGRHLARSGKESYDDIKEGKEERREADIEEAELNKNLSDGNDRGGGGSKKEDMARSLQNPKTANLDRSGVSLDDGNNQRQREIDAKRRAARTKTAKGIGRVTGGAFTGIVGAAIGAGTGGGIRGASQLGMVSYMGGQALGGKISSSAYDSHQGNKANKKMEEEISNLQNDIAYEQVSQDNNGVSDEGELRNLAMNKLDSGSNDYDKSFANETRKLAENRYVGLEHEKLDGTKWQEQERQARMVAARTSNARTSLPVQQLARMKYAQITPARKSSVELSQINDAHMYQDFEKSIIYRQTQAGSPEVLAVAQGNPTLSQPINNPVSFNSGVSQMPNDIQYDIQTQSALHAEEYMNTAYPEMQANNPEYRQLYNEQANDYKREAKSNYNNCHKSLQQNLNIGNLSIQTNQQRLSDLVHVDKVRQVEKQKIEVNRQREAAKSKTHVEMSKNL